MCEKGQLMTEMKLGCNVDLQKEKKFCAELRKISCDMDGLQKNKGFNRPQSFYITTIANRKK